MKPGKRNIRRAEAHVAFEALAIEGGLLSPDWLSRAAQLTAGGQSEADYHIPKGLNLRDEIGRFWRIAHAHWAEFEAGRTAGADPRTLSERFVEALLRDSFGFSSLSRAVPVSLAERSYPIGFAAFDGRVPVVIANAGSGLDTPLPQFGDETRRRSPFGLAQEYLNAADGALWGLAADGIFLRLLRDNASLTRPAWIEADLGRIFSEERYADFTALWLLIHESRFGRADRPATECALEQWREAGRAEGTRARDHLRRGVEEALLAFAQGFLSHAANSALRTALQDGSLTPVAFFQQLLRLVYRLIFLLTVEERGLLHPEASSSAARDIYAEAYSLKRLRDRSLKRSAHDRFSDLWETLKIVFRGLSTAEPRLALPALAGLFATIQCPALDAAKLENRALLLAIFRLGWLREDAGLTRVNWRDMGPEELGSVYESLLELVPRITQGGRAFAFAAGDETKGNARKTTGSYYTPDSLVQVLLDTALEPVVESTLAAHPDRGAEALLGLSIVDPACGSGHFLLAAARRLAAHIARIQANGTPSATEYRHALRQVVSRCLCGVDLNPMAVELCKVSLWMEAVEPGLPLTFLDSHILHGNALLGTTPELMAKGIPDTAWEPIERDDRRIASALKKRNKLYGKTQLDMSAILDRDNGAAGAEQQIVSRAVAALEAAPDTDASALARKESQWAGLLDSDAYRHQRSVADAWCAAFVWPKQPGLLSNAAPTNELWRQIRDGRNPPPSLTVQTINDLARQYRFFHWHLAFPQVFTNGGFDVVLGNPPWERVKLQEQEFFASVSDEIANAPNAAARKRLIASLPSSDPVLWANWCDASREAEGQSHFVRQSGRFPLTGRGDVNTYPLFAEHNLALIRITGRAGFIVPTGIATDDTTKQYFQKIVDDAHLGALFDFQSGPGLFGAIGHGTFKFSLLTLCGSTNAKEALFSFYSRSAAAARSPESTFSLRPEDIRTLNPNTRTCPTFRSRRDADINLEIYRRAGILWRDDDPPLNPWGLRFLRMLDMANDSDLFQNRIDIETAGWSRRGNRYVKKEEELLPLIEAKMVCHFDHRFGDYQDHPAGSENLILPEVSVDRLIDPSYSPLGRYWVPAAACNARLEGVWDRDWLLGWRDVTKPQNERTVIASLIPRVAAGDTFLLALSTVGARLTAGLYANLCSFILDYAARQKVGGTHLKYHTFKQLPVLAPSVYEQPAPWDEGTSLRDWLLPRVLELTYTAWNLEAFAHDVLQGSEPSATSAQQGFAAYWRLNSPCLSLAAHSSPPPFRWDTGRRFLLRAELDAAFFHLYAISRDDTDYILDTFPIVRKHDEKAHGEYRTKRAILEIFDAMSEAAHIGRSYLTPLDPPPADPRCCHPAK